MYQGEKFNSISHLIGTVLSLMGLGALIAVSVEQNNLRLIASFSSFGLSMVLLYAMSTLYHSFRPERYKKLFQILDHIAIFLLIAGTYTPYMLITLYEGNGPLILGVVWGLAVIGMILQFIAGKIAQTLQLLVYLGMGWAIAFDLEALKTQLAEPGYWWLVVGGIAYTSGVIFYVLDKLIKMRHAHGIWHLFVMLGTASHFISIIGYVR